MAMSKKDQALRLTAEYLLRCYYNYKGIDTEIAKQIKTYADLCCLALPMKYRFTREELHEMGLPGKD